ncbi:Phosphoglycerate dehydrogenase and related dehydrogenases [Faecalitalea cylindroides T2-87]|uniref:Phosphoglycerate dehydrogenase and related dehydrogenases n=1 Tax=Faecalitalea cylindroides T2-87 TaxID=717960 RepID=D4JG73_9FIRM|nr:Phosphoglycerate dehydrogenase and related dehydrogenases [Faecalitalea cylindroides T2-87]
MQIFMIVTSQKGVIDMRAGFIGAGKVGFSLGKYLKENGVEITGYFSKSPESAKSAADFTNTKLYKSIENILSDSDTLFITVPDGQISKVWDYMKNLDIKNKNICHCSGSISSTVFLMVKTSVQISIRYIPYMQ